jgi:hypothetical protein
MQQQNPNREAKSSSLSQLIPWSKWSTKANWRLERVGSCPYPEPHQSSARLFRPVSQISILLLSSHLRLVLPSGLFPSGFPIKTLYTPLLCPYVLHASPISNRPMWSPEWYLVNSKNHEDPQCVIFSIPLLPSPYQVLKFSSIPFLKNLQPTFLPHFVATSVTPIQNNRQNYGTVSINYVKYLYSQVFPLVKAPWRVIKHNAPHLGLDAERKDNSDSRRQPAMKKDRSEFIVAPVSIVAS